ncbi:hypothetical protein H1R20_g9860, partial [Candolleomyces eurysporus]
MRMVQGPGALRAEFGIQGCLISFPEETSSTSFDLLTCFWECAKVIITRDTGSVPDLSTEEDAGVGMVNSAVYQIIGHIAHPDSAKICAWSGANSLRLKLTESYQTLLMHHPVRLDPAPFADFMQYFSECNKPDYSGVKDDADMLH